MSLLDFFTKGTGDPEKDAAITNGLLQAGLALMQSKGKLFPALGQAGMVGLQAGQQTQQQQLQARRAALQDKMLRGQVDEQDRQAQINALPGQFYRAPSMPGMDATGGIETALEAPNNQASPDGRFDTRGWLDAYRAKAGPVAARAAEMALAKPDVADQIVPEGAAVLRGGVPVFTNAKAPQQSADYRDWLAEVAAKRTNLGYTEWAQKMKRAGASNVSLNVPVNTEKTYAGNLAETLAKVDSEAIEAARSAPERIRSARQVKQILSTQTPITGTLADQRLILSKALATAGVISEDSAAATETLAATLAGQTLDAIRSSGLGPGNGFTNADREFLERAKAGKIDMTQGALLKLADLNERSAIRAIERGNKVTERLRGNPSLGTVRDALETIEMPSEIRLPTAADIAAEQRRRQGGR